MSFDELNVLKIEELTAFTKRVQVSFKIVNKGEVREITSRRSGETHNLCDIQVADSTGSIILTLWDNDIDLVEEGKDYTLSNGYVNVFQNSMRLSKGKYGDLSDAEEEIEEVNTENNLSDQHIESQRPSRRYNTGGYGRDRSGRGRDTRRDRDRGRGGWYS
ncbi:MAG: single-stranded DNA-binding protein [Candidatus Hermodarchaeota archaeon]